MELKGVIRTTDRLSTHKHIGNGLAAGHLVKGVLDGWPVIDSVQLDDLEGDIVGFEESLDF